MKKILFYTHDISFLENPKAYRILQYFPYLEKSGFQVKLMTTRTRMHIVIKEIMASDILYIQRILLNPIKLSIFKSFAKKMVYDFDDAVMYGSKGKSATRRSRFKGMVKTSDVVFCGNEFLLKEARAYKKNGIYYIPTVVDTDEYPVKVHVDKLPFIVGWIGSSSTLRYLADIKELLISMAYPERLHYKIVADKPLDIQNKGVLFEKWNKDMERKVLLSFDIGIMPLKNDIWSDGKCGLKLIQYMATGLPSIAHPVGVANSMISDGVNGFLRIDTNGWREAIEILSKDTVLRNKMGEASRTIAEERYSLKVCGPRLAEIVSTL
jgi:glycosyltransferase involved in cell wall biosynthesis